MKITEKENILLRRALDPASSPNEAAKAAEAFIASLRKRGLNGYDFVPHNRQATASGPQARPSDTPPPQPPPPQPPPPQQPQQRAYEQARESWHSRFGRRVRSWLYRIAFFGALGLIGHQCSQHHDSFVPTVRPETRPTPANPVGSIENPYRFLNWKDYTDYNSLPMFSNYIDPENRIRKKMPPPAATPSPTVAPLGDVTNPYRINWSAADGYEHFKNLPAYSFYIDWDGSVKQK
jgi:hypothetical protein